MAYWVQYIESQQWMPGTVVTVPSSVSPFLHFAMVDFVNFHNSEQMAIHSMPGTGVTKASFGDLIAGKAVKVYSRPRSHQDGSMAVLRMQSLIGHSYDLIESNCEHVIRWAITGEWRSDQVSVVRTGLVFAGAVALAACL